MTLSLSIIAAVFVVVFVLELPDKTMLATLVLSSQYRPVPVLVGVAGAFALQMVIAVAVGGALTLLPRTITLAIVAVLFGIGTFLLAREAFGKEEEEAPTETAHATSFWRIVLISFGLLFLAEFGDGSQLAAAALSARYEEPLSVFVGAWLAEMSVCTLAAFGGQALLKVVPLKWVQRVAMVIFGSITIVVFIEWIRAF